MDSLDRIFVKANSWTKLREKYVSLILNMQKWHPRNKETNSIFCFWYDVLRQGLIQDLDSGKRSEFYNDHKYSEWFQTCSWGIFGHTVSTHSEVQRQSPCKLTPKIVSIGLETCNLIPLSSLFFNYCWLKTVLN